MTKFILLYNGNATPAEEMTAEQRDDVMSKWQNWMDKNGDGIVDIGSPMVNGVSVVDDGSDGAATPLSGYSIIEAVDIDGARMIIADHPFLSDKTGNFSVEIHELLPAPM